MNEQGYVHANVVSPLSSMNLTLTIYLDNGLAIMDVDGSDN
jgi:hypothetical protein